MQIKVYGDDRIIYSAMYSENSGCLLYLFTNLTDKFLLHRQTKIRLLKTERQ